MQIYVGKGGQQLGPFTLEEINRKLADATFAGTDLAWYEGAPGWAPLSGVPGVVVPPAATSAAPPAVTPPPAAMPVAAPVRVNIPSAQPSTSSPGKPYKAMARIAWALLGVTLLVSFIPFLGCGSWILVWPVAVIAIILGIVVMTRGGTGHGIGLIIASIVLVPVALVAPILATALFGNAADQKNATQIMQNLRTLDGAKGQWVTQTKAANGAPVTMANLTTYLSGKEIKPVVNEQYDPMPVGQAPIATLPAGKTLGSFKGGDALTAAAIEKDIASGGFSLSSKNSWSLGGTTPTPTAAPTIAPTVAPAASPKPSPSPSETVPPPPTAPKSSSTPHSLISPRQSEEPDDSPSTRPSPSAKFAPRNGPRRSPAPSEKPSDSEKSGGLRQGRKDPRESPGATPEKSPDDDDE